MLPMEKLRHREVRSLTEVTHSGGNRQSQVKPPPSGFHAQILDVYLEVLSFFSATDPSDETHGPFLRMT